MKIYTKTGDDGTTGLFGGGRVPKTSLRIEAYGTVDELNSCIGMARSVSNEFGALLQKIQQELFVLGGDLATPLTTRSDYPVPRTNDDEVRALERAIDEHDAQLPALRRFILPGGTPLAAHLHHARTVCRRAERCVIALAQTEEITPANVIYLNRLSDLLFVLARRANQIAGVSDVEWEGAGN